MDGVDHSLLDTFFSRLPDLRVLALGDLMVDQYLWGGVERISPEAPVPVVDVRGETRRPGGAGNVVENLLALGCRVAVAGVVGEDEEGRWLRDRFAGRGLDTAGVLTDPARETSRKTRVMTGHQQVLRVDRETRTPLSEEMEKRLAAFVEEQIPRVQAVLVSDYLKGTLSGSLLQRVIALGRQRSIPVVIDPKGLDYSRYRGACLLTPNRKEAEAVVRYPLSSLEELLRAGKHMVAELNLEHLVITLGDEGMMLFSPDGSEVRHRHLPAREREVFDVSGAGDTVLAVLGLGLAAGLDPGDVAGIANLAAGVVVGKVGTSTADPREIRAATGLAPGNDRKVKDRWELKRILEQKRRKGQKVVFTNGCFDLLHVGHLKCLQAARSFGDLLVLGLNSDDSVRRLKGPRRPLIGEEDRATLLAGLSCVDFVVVFEEDTPESLIETLRPDVLVKGGDYEPSGVVGRELVESYGGRVEIVKLFEGRSTSALIDAILVSGRD